MEYEAAVFRRHRFTGHVFFCCQGRTPSSAGAYKQIWPPAGQKFLRESIVVPMRQADRVDRRGR